MWFNNEEPPIKTCHRDFRGNRETPLLSPTRKQWKRLKEDSMTNSRDCSGARVLDRLEREAPISALEKARRLEDRLTFIRHYFRVKPGSSDPVERAIFRCVVDCIFGKDYALTSEQGDLASIQCQLSETRW